MFVGIVGSVDRIFRLVDFEWEYLRWFFRGRVFYRDYFEFIRYFFKYYYCSFFFLDFKCFREVFI